MVASSLPCFFAPSFVHSPDLICSWVIVPFWAAVSLAASTGAAPPTNKPATDRMVMILVLFIFVSPWYDFLLFLTDLRIIKKYGRSVFLKAHLCGIIGVKT